MKLLSEHACWSGTQRFFQHDSSECAGPMRLAVYEPPQAKAGPVPVLYYLAGLTCTEETFPIKAGAQRLAAEHGLMLVAPDTSPREPRLRGDDASWDFGLAAGFYVDATQAPWSAHYRMYSYVTRELPALLAREFEAADTSRQSIMGHSMGGHGALVCALRNPGQYRSVSAFAPIVAPSQVPWGHKAFSNYLGANRGDWLAYDATHQVQQAPRMDTILIDQGLGDKFLTEQLRPELFEDACQWSGQPLQLRRHAEYDHGYYFIQTFMPDHIAFHAASLRHA
ncbi:MAG: S-formylglutathione hydrolase [Gammaproteobacteria bacterium]|nr:S-formylglutathione hydrolase [Gammaproteobacteria bacterium]